MSELTAGELLENLRLDALDADRLASRVEKVLAIHKRTSTDGKYCGYCGRVYPCPTVRILNGGGE